jgi:ribosomal protein L11 methylase PrmA
MIPLLAVLSSLPWANLQVHGFMVPRLQLAATTRTRRSGSTSRATFRVGVGHHRASITDWVIENLEPHENQTITSRSAVRAGENDTLPVEGLRIGAIRILAADAEYTDQLDKDGTTPTVRLLVGRNGWGTGVHPTTRLCVEWICDTLQGGETILDYGWARRNVLVWMSRRKPWLPLYAM